MKNQSVTFASRPEFLATKFIFYGPTGIAWSPYGPYWRQPKALLHGAALRPAHPVVLLHRDGGDLDLMRDIARSAEPRQPDREALGLSNAVVCRAAFGSSEHRRDSSRSSRMLWCSAASAWRHVPSLKLIDILGCRVQLLGGSGGRRGPGLHNQGT
ncbi:unnamed protein product [Musa acuminata subsp. burmannicoides]